MVKVEIFVLEHSLNGLKNNNKCKFCVCEITEDKMAKFDNYK